MSSRLLHDRLIVVRLQAIDVTAARLFLHQSEEQTQQIGRVVAVSREQALDDGYLSSLDIACGDDILYSRYAGSEIRLEGDRYLILREDEVLGVWEVEDAESKSHTVSISAFSQLHANAAGCLTNAILSDEQTTSSLASFPERPE